MSYRGRATLLMRIAVRADLGETLLFLIHTNRDELDHRLGNAEAALKLGDNCAVGLNRQQHVVAVVELADE